MIINISELLSTTEKTESYSVPLECNAFNIHGQDYRIIEKAPVELTIKRYRSPHNFYRREGKSCCGYSM